MAVGVGSGSSVVSDASVAVGRAGVWDGVISVGAAWQASGLRMKREMIINSREFGLRIDVLSRLRTLPILLNSPDCWSDEVPAKLCNETALYVHQ